MNFFRTTALLCTRISALPQIAGSAKLWRAVLHTFLLMLLCAVIASTVTLLQEKGNMRRILTGIHQETGGIFFKSGRLYLGNQATEKHIAFSLKNTPLRTDFAANADEVRKLAPDDWRENAGVLATRDRVCLWLRAADQRYSAMILPVELLQKALDPATAAEAEEGLWNNMLKQHLLTTEDMIRKLTPEASDPQTDKTPSVRGTELNLLSAYAVSLSILWSFQFSFLFREMLILIIIGLPLFTVVQWMRGKVFPKKLSFKLTAALMLYCMFPAFIIATILDLCQNFIDYQTVFFPVFFFYQMAAFNTLVRTMNPPGNSEMSDDDF